MHISSSLCEFLYPGNPKEMKQRNRRRTSLAFFCWTILQYLPLFLVSIYQDEFYFPPFTYTCNAFIVRFSFLVKFNRYSVFMPFPLPSLSENSGSYKDDPRQKSSKNTFAIWLLTARQVLFWPQCFPALPRNCKNKQEFC